MIDSGVLKTYGIDSQQRLALRFSNQKLSLLSINERFERKEDILQELSEYFTIYMEPELYQEVKYNKIYSFYNSDSFVRCGFMYVFKGNYIHISLEKDDEYTIHERKEWAKKLEERKNTKNIVIVKPKAVKNHKKNKDTVKEAFTYVEQMPKFGNGDNDYMVYIKEGVNKIREKHNLKKDQINVYVVEFVISEEGYVESPKITHSSNSKFEKEIIELYKLMPKWTSGKNFGKPVRVFLSDKIEL